MTKADRGARIPPTPGSRTRSSSLYGADVNLVRRKVSSATRYKAKTFPVKHRYIDAAAAEAAVARKIAELEGVEMPRSVTERTVSLRDDMTAKTFKPPPHADKIPPQHSGQKPKYQGYATPFTPGQLAHLVDAPGKVTKVPQFIPKSRNIKPEVREMSVRSDRIAEFLKGVRANQDRIVSVGKVTELGWGLRSVQVRVEYADLDLEQIEEGNLYVKDDKGPKVTVIRHYYESEVRPLPLEERPICGGERLFERPPGVLVFEDCKVCQRLLDGGPEAIEAHKALLSQEV